MKNIIDDLSWRYAVKKFNPNKKIKKEDLDLLIESFILTPSSLGLQPWKLIYLTDIEKRKQISPFCWNDSQIMDSNGIFILVRKIDISDNLVDSHINYIVSKTGASRDSLKLYEEMMKKFLNNLDSQQKIAWAERQVMIALGNMINVCAIQKIDSCPIEGFSKEKIDEILGLTNKGLASVVLLPVGYRDENDEHLKRGKIRFTRDMLFEQI